MIKHKPNENYNEETVLSEWWKIIKGNFSNIFLIICKKYLFTLYSRRCM